MQKHKKCLICSSDQLDQLPGYYERHELIKCKSCGFVFMENVPSIEDLNSYYSKYSYASKGYLSPLTVKSYNLLLDEFEKYRKKNKILDIGCGRGWFLQEAKKRGWDAFGTEFSETAIQICESEGIKIKTGQLTSETFPLEEFDIITSFEVIEHINNPIEETSYIYKFLRNGGLFYCTTPNFNSLLRFYLKETYNMIAYPEHLSYYTKNSLKKLFKKQGFMPHEILSTGISVARIKTSKKPGAVKLLSEESSDEKLRQKINDKWYLGYLKIFVNYLLTLFGLGITLKGYFIKK